MTQSGHGISGTSLRNGRLLPVRRRASADASLATIWLVRDGRWVFSQRRCELAEHHQDRDQEDQRKAAANDSDRNLDRKRICDADGVAKNVDQPFHVVSPGEVEREAQLNLRAARQEASKHGHEWQATTACTDVRYWHLADITSYAAHVRFRG